jgi:L-ribulokinase
MVFSDSLIIGLDFGTDSARAILVDAETGKQLALSSKLYKLWNQGLYLDPARFQFRHHPLDYLESMEYVVREVLHEVPGAREKVRAIGLTATGSTPVAVDAEGTPLAMKPAFSDYPNAMFILWKDHTGHPESEHINAFTKGLETDYTRQDLCGQYSTEHFWTKALHIFRDPRIKSAAHSFVEASDWLPGELSGNTRPETLKRGMGIASSRAMWNPRWGGYPPNTYFKALDPALDGLIDTFDARAYPCNEAAGTLSAKWADLFGLSEEVVVATGSLDCHAGAVGAGVRAKSMVEIIGTSTCAITVSAGDGEIREVPGVPQQAPDMILPGMVGYEGGQSCFGDLYAWFKKILMWPLDNILASTTLVDEATRGKLIEEVYHQMIPALTAQARTVPCAESRVIATDWINGRRSPNVDYGLKGTITGLTLSTTAPLLYKSLVEATAFGAKAFIEQFRSNGGALEEVIAVGGISQKSSYVMQMLSDVIGIPIHVADAPEACALGAAMCAATAAGVHADVREAQQVMQGKISAVYTPEPKNSDHYRVEYKKYQNLEEVKRLTN